MRSYLQKNGEFEYRRNLNPKIRNGPGIPQTVNASFFGIARQPTLWPAFGRVFPSSDARRLRILVDCSLWNSDRLLCGLCCQRRLWKFVPHFLGVFGGEQRSHYPQSFDFLFQPGQLKLFLSKYFVNILHIVGTCGGSKWSNNSNSSRLLLFVKHLEGSM